MNKQLTNKKKQTLQPVKSYMKRVTLSAMVLSSLVGVTLPSIVNAQEPNNKTVDQQEQVAIKQVKASTVKSEDTTIEPLDLKKVAAEIKEKKLRETVELTPVVEEFLTKGVDKIVTKGLDLEKTILNIEHEKPEPVIEEVVEPVEVVEEVEEPVYEEPVYEEPVYEEPVYEEPVYEEPVYEEPVYEEPVYVEPVVEEPVYEEPVQATSGTHMRVQATMYSQHQAGLSNMTAAGYNLNENPNIIAVNPSIIPFGSVVEIVGVGTYIAGDTGSFTTWGGDYTTGIDIHTNDLSQAIAFGKQFVDIIVY